MASYNRIILIGNLTRDPEYKQLASGQAVCRLGLAVNRQFKNRQSGSMVQEVCYVEIDVWGPQAESCRQYLQKGRPVLIEGRLKYDTWEDTSGQTRSKHMVVADRVVFLGSNVTIEDESGKEVAVPDQGIMQLNSNNPVERDLMNQLERAKTKIKATTKESKEVEKSTGEIDYNDQPPFTDELPF
jgi:single-strand DNA-binding protein